MAGFVEKILKSGLGIFTSRIFGFIRDVAVAAFFGVSVSTDAFFIAFAVPNLFRAFFAEGALSSAFIPFLSDRLSREGEDAASAYLFSLMAAVSVPVFLIICLSLFYADKFILLFMPGQASNIMMVSEAASMLMLLMPYLYFITLCALLSCYLNLKGSYFAPNASTAVLNIFMIAGAVYGYLNSKTIIYLCYGVFFGGVFQFLIVFFYAVKKGFRPGFHGGFDKSVLKIFYLVLPSLAGVGINQLNFMAGRAAATFLAAGSVSYLYYANRLFQFPLGMFAVAVGSVTLAEISASNSAGNFEKRNHYIDKSVNAILVIMLPATAGLVLLAEPIMLFVYGRMDFTAADAQAAAGALVAYSSGLLFFSFVSVFSRIFYTDKDVRTPVYAAGIAFAVNLGLMPLFMKFYGHSGVALASSFAAAVNFIFLYLKLKNYTYNLKRYGFYVFKVASGTLIMAVAAFFMNYKGVNLFVSIAVSCFAYFGFLYMSGIDFRRVLR